MEPEKKSSDISQKEKNHPFANPRTSVALSDHLTNKMKKMGMKGDSEDPIIIDFQDICAAAFRIRKGITKTPCEVRYDLQQKANIFTPETADLEIFFKKEYLHPTGSFKERGALNTLLLLSESKDYAVNMAREKGLAYINGYDHPHILSGQGTIGLEIINQVYPLDAIIVPVGGGGMIAGIAKAVKAVYPHVQIIAVESERCPSFKAAMDAGKPVKVEAHHSETIADGLCVPLVGSNAFANCKDLVDKVVIVSEDYIGLAILYLMEMEKAVVEGAGASGLAAILSGQLPELKGKRVVIPLCGGNIDPAVVGRCIDRGLATDGRLVRFVVTVSDRPGGIDRLVNTVAKAGANIKDMFHERAWLKSSVFKVQCKVVAEVRDRAHGQLLKATLENTYEEVHWNTDHATSYT
ncbi:hypothetical protein QZH41_018826 [Actinostola sp. cb2023]|nr:hypothetical protein QZH41_018826 [Actinostola sp. cb2023]